MDNKTLETFFSLISDQMIYGGKKYALSGISKKESTDILFDIHGMTWLFGTMHKYCFRFSNLKRERDLLKIATYCYLLWLKRGFFCKETGTSEGLDTSLTIKEMFFEDFKNRVFKFKENFSVKGDPIPVIGNILTMWSNGSWEEVREDAILTVLLITAFTWNTNFDESQKGKDLDTWNETENLKK